MTRVLCTQINAIDMQLIIGDGKRSVFSSRVSDELDESNEDPDPLCSIPLGLEWANISSYWVMRKADEINDCVVISYKGFEEQVRALLIAIEAGQPSLVRSASKNERELKRLSCSINYNVTEGSAYRGKGKERAANSYF